MGAISTDGGRYDVDIINKERVSVYWDEAPSKIKRCTWFWKADTDAQFHPCDEDLCGILEVGNKLFSFYLIIQTSF